MAWVIFVVLAPAGESAMFEAKLVVYYQSRLLAMRIHRLSRCQLYLHAFWLLLVKAVLASVLQAASCATFAGFTLKLGRRLLSTRGQATGPRPNANFFEGGVPGLSLLLPKHLQSGQAVWGLPWGHKSGPQLFVGIGTIAND